MPKYNIEPVIESDVEIGTGEGKDLILVGKLAEWGTPKHVWLDISKEFVAVVVGQRGSGKSFSLGSLLEAICTKDKKSSISKRESNRAVLLFDPTGNFWTTCLPLRASGSDRVLRQYKLLEGWPIRVEDVDTSVWIPAGYKFSTDYPGTNEFHFDTANFEAQDWADILDVNIMSDPQGMLLADIYFKLTVEGWEDENRQYPPTERVTVNQLITCLETDMNIASGNSGYTTQTIRALRRSLRTYAHHPLFAGGATKLNELLREGQLSILMMPYRVDRNLRSVLSRVLIKQILRDREVATNIQNRLDLETVSEEEQIKLKGALCEHIPRTIVALDEAQELLGDRGGVEREALEDFCLVGRNYGLSMIIATQRPETSALSAKVRDQAGIWVIHNLGSQANINTVMNNLIADVPSCASDGKCDLEIPSLIRRLEAGQAFVASKEMRCKNAVKRAFVMDVRPRVRIHGGEAS